MDREEPPPPANIIRHEQRERPFELAIGDGELIEAISAHIERWLGPVESVYHELISDLVHVDLHWVKPTKARPFNSLVSTGMSERPMTVPPGAEDFSFAELVLNLPPDWPMTEDAWSDEANFWPVRLLKQLARMPHEYSTWLCGGHTVQANPDGAPYHSSTTFTGAVLTSCVSAPDEFSQLEIGSRVVHFWSVVPLYPDELTYKLKRGVDGLFDRLDAAGLADALVPGRKNLCRRRWFEWRG